MKKGKVKIGLLLLAVLLLGVFFVFRPKKPQAASLTSASATLSNSRLSFYGAVSGGASAGATTINIKTTGNYGDLNTNHLFPGDTVAVGINGGKTVGTVIDADTFVLSDGLSVAVADGTAIYATQSGTLTISFTITNSIPAGGYVRVLIPDPPANGNDGAPDTADSVANNGFDLNGMTTANITTSGGTGCTWGTATLTAGSGSSHQYKVTTTTACTGGTITVTVGDETKGLVNPAPIYSGHTQGTADIYTIDVDTFDGDPDGSGNQIDTVDIKVAPVEAVLVSATVDETLTFVVSASASGSTACGVTSDVTTTATSIPWGTISTADSFLEAIQAFRVSTNADGGYTLKIEENDQMGKDGNACSGASAGEANNCIQDTTCGASACTESAARDWTDAATYHGLGFSLQDITGNDAVFDYNGKPAETTCTSGTFCARQIADQEAGETKATIMSSSGPANNSRVAICYRISISATQPAGYYYNKVKYTVTATF